LPRAPQKPWIMLSYRLYTQRGPHCVLLKASCKLS
jgi:hypothetical protein